MRSTLTRDQERKIFLILLAVIISALVVAVLVLLFTKSGSAGSPLPQQAIALMAGWPG